MMHGLFNAVGLLVLSKKRMCMYEFSCAEWILACACGIFARMILRMILLMILMYMVSDDRQGKAVDKIMLNPG